MTVLYILGNGSKHDNIELRWSLRSLAKYARDVDRVIVAGNPPDWLSSEVERLHYDQHLVRVNRNIPDTAVAAIKQLNLTGDIVLAYDDCILTEPTTFSGGPLFCRAWSLPSSTDSGNGYFRALVETRKFLVEHSLPAIDFEAHAFKVFSADSIRSHKKLVRESIDESRFGVTADCLFSNLTLADNPRRHVVYREDIKLRTMTAADFNRDWCISFSDSCFEDPSFVQLMNDFYGEPCKYEVP